MDLGQGLDLLMFAAAVGLLMAGYPVAFTLAGTALAFAFIGMALGVFDFSFLLFFPQRIFGTMTNETLIAVPLFVFMGVMLERSKVAEDLLVAMGRLFGSLRGGLGISVVLVGALLAASTGIVGATVVTMGLLSLPTMLRHGYSPGLATGTINAAGTLGQIIPPSIVLVLLGDVLATAYDQAQREMGTMNPDPVTVGDLFAGSLIPGLVLVSLYISYVVAVAIFRPNAAPAVKDGEDPSFGDLFGALAPPLILIIAVLGSILGGIATPTEAAAVGAIGAVLLAAYRDAASKGDVITQIAVLGGGAAAILLLILRANFDLRWLATGRTDADALAFTLAIVACAVLAVGLCIGAFRVLRVGQLGEAARSTATISSMVFIILIGAALFSLVFRGLGGDDTVHEILSSLPGGTAGAIIAVMLMMFFLGFFLDFIEITFVVVPIVAPILLMMGVDPVWLGVMMALNLQTSFLTPPFGFALFYLRGVAPESVRTAEIYKGVIPFVFIQILMLGLLALFPQLATWLPGLLVNN